MTKGEQIVALAMEKVSREGYPKLTEDHPFFGRLRAFMVVNGVIGKAFVKSEAKRS